MAWTVLWCPIVAQTSWGIGGTGATPSAVTFGAIFDADGNPITDASGNAIQITGTTALSATARQPSDYWDALQANMESQLTGLDGYETGTTYFRIDLPTA